MKINSILRVVVFIFLIGSFLLASCTGADSLPSDSTLEASQTPGLTSTIAPTATNTPEASKTATPEPTPTSEPPPARWDDPELLADVRAEFEAATGTSVEDYYNKAVDDGVVSVGESNVSLQTWKYGVNKLNGIGLGARAVETGDGTLHLVAYFARRSGDGVGVYPLDVAVERNGVFAQTSLGKMDDIDQSANVMTNLIHFSSVEGGVEQLDRLVMGSRVDLTILVAFRSLDECNVPQNTYTPQMDEGYWAYAQGQCRTEGTYLNFGSHEPLTVREGGVEFSGTYNIDAIMGRSGPAAGLVVKLLGLFTLD